MNNGHRIDLERKVICAEAAILALVSGVVPGIALKRIGPLDFGTPSWSCWVITATDRERDRLANDKGLLERLRNAAHTAGFAPDSFTFQSQETIDRDYEGKLFYAMR
jgi:hypothetical protein